MPLKKEELEALIRSGKKEEIEALIRSGELVLKCDATATYTVVHEHVTKEEFEEARLERMDVSKILAELKAEREQIEEAVLNLERLARGRGRRPGRPPNWMADVTPPKRRGRPP